MKFRLRPPSAPKLKENDVEQACLDLLRYRGWYCKRQHVGRWKTPDGRWTTIGEPGDPDYFCAHKDYPSFFLETKRPKGRLSPKQEQKHWEITVAYGIRVATIDRVEALIPWLDAHEARARDP